jgi:hypothetical protein
MRAFRTRADKVAWIRTEREAGRTLDSIAQELGISRERVRQLCPGIKRHPPWWNAIDWRVGAPANSRRLGRSVESIRYAAEILGRTMPRVPLRPCGTSAAYARGCRCDACRRAAVRRLQTWQRANPEKVRATRRAWEAANKDKMDAYRRAWQQERRQARKEA